MSLDGAMDMDFDEIIDRVGTHCSKWDKMEALYGVDPRDGISMWVADMDFRAAPCIQRAVEAQLRHGIYGYFGDDGAYLDAIRWWMETRHGWQVAPEWIFTTHGLVNGTGICVEAFTEPGDGVVLMTPVYHAFGRVIRASVCRATTPSPPGSPPCAARSSSTTCSTRSPTWVSPCPRSARWTSRWCVRSPVDQARSRGSRLPPEAS